MVHPVLRRRERVDGDGVRGFKLGSHNLLNSILPDARIMHSLNPTDAHMQHKKH